MLTYPWKCTVLHCNHLGNTWKPLVLMTRHFDYCPSASEGDNQSVRSSAPVVSRCFPGGYNVKLYISMGRLAWWLLTFLHSDSFLSLEGTWYTYFSLTVYTLSCIVWVKKSDANKFSSRRGCLLLSAWILRTEPSNSWSTTTRLVAKWLEQASQWHEMYCHDLEVMSSNPGRVELGVHSTSALSHTWNSKYILYGHRYEYKKLSQLDK